ncbi:MAG: DUF2167 domain-containing protein [Cypionkella sp.]
MKPVLHAILPVLVALCFALPSAAEDFKTAFPEAYAQLGTEYQAGIGALELQHGTVKLADGTAEIVLPDAFYMLNAKDSRYVLEKLWENPPDDTILGLILPKGATPFDGGWAVTITSDPMGYVSDDDADSYNYDDMLASMQKDAQDGNAERTKAGYAAVEIKGWAATPHYDKATRKLYWAKRLQFAGSPSETLNYDIRILGRKGVLVLGFIAGLDQLAAVEGAAPEVLKMVNFTEGNRYSDYVPGVDTVAAVGIGGLIAGQVAAKTGLLVLALAFLKKGFILVLLVGAALLGKLKSLFGGKPAAPSAQPLHSDGEDDTKPS